MLFYADAAILIASAMVNVYLGSIVASKKVDQFIAGDENAEIVELNLYHVLGFPVAASASLITLFFYFQYLQSFILVVVLFVSFISLQVLLFNFISENAVANKIFPSFRTQALFSTLVAIAVLLEWLHSGSIVLHDVIGSSLCIFFISTIRLPSFKLVCLLLCLLLVYDCYWVFYSEHHFSSNVMMAVAGKAAVNPVVHLGDKFGINWLKHFTKEVEMPVKLMFPSFSASGRMTMLGLGDIALPGLIVSFALEIDNACKAISTAGSTLQLTSLEEGQIKSEPSDPNLFQAGLAGYFVSLVVAFAISKYTMQPQPALLYIVPMVIVAIIIQSLRKGRFNELLNRPKRLHQSF